MVHINKNEYETHDAYWYMGIETPSLKGEFFSLRRTITEDFNQNVNTHKAMYHMDFSIAHIQYKYERIVYTVWDVIGDIGGVIDVILAILGIFMGPYTDIALKSHLISNFYTYSHSRELDEDSKVAVTEQDLEKTDEQHKQIVISNNDFWYLFTWKCFKLTCCTKSDLNQKRLRKIYEKGELYLEEDFDVELQIKQNRKLRAWFMQSNVIDQNVLNAIMNEKNLDESLQHNENIEFIKSVLTIQHHKQPD